MFEAGFAYILSKSLMNTRTKNPLIPFGIGGFFFFSNILIILGKFYYCTVKIFMV